MILHFASRTDDAEKVCEKCKHYLYVDLYEVEACDVNVRANHTMKRWQRVFRPWEMSCEAWEVR